MNKVAEAITKFTGAKPGDDAAFKVWLILTEAGAISSVLIVPYALELTGRQLAEANKRLAEQGKKAVGIAQAMPVAGLQGQINFGLLSAVGLRAARSLNLGVPHLEAALRGKRSGLKGRDVLLYSVSGAGAGLGIYVLDKLAFDSVRNAMKDAGVKEPRPWKSLLATFYGGIGEEIMLRLAAQSGIAVGLRRLLKGKGKRGAVGGSIMWPAITIGNLAFGAGHLPTVTRLVKLTPAVIMRTLVLNAFAGTLFGYLYWKRGLEAAIIAHASADLVIHVGGAILHKEPEGGEPHAEMDRTEESEAQQPGLVLQITPEEAAATE
jgi:membrane protease YdiL (CAAX protease family)